jgi:hypothetical protein
MGDKQKKRKKEARFIFQDASAGVVSFKKVIPVQKFE